MTRKQEMNSRHNSQSGLAIWYILVGVALFAALSYSFMRSVSQSSSGASKEQARIMANEILRYGKTLEQGVQRLRLVNGCSENEISFYSPKWATPADFDNTNSLFAGGDFNCHIYQRDGAGVNWQTFGAQNLNGQSEDVYISSAFAIEDVGTALTDLVFYARINDVTCDVINTQVLISADNDADGVVSTYAAGFTGAYTLVDTIGDAAAHAGVAGNHYGCFIDTNDHYVFYNVLLDR